MFTHTDLPLWFYRLAMTMLDRRHPSKPLLKLASATLVAAALCVLVFAVTLGLTQGRRPRSGPLHELQALSPIAYCCFAGIGLLCTVAGLVAWLRSGRAPGASKRGSAQAAAGERLAGRRTTSARQ